MAGAPPFFQDYSFIVYVFYVFVKRANKPPSDLTVSLGGLFFAFPQQIFFVAVHLVLFFFGQALALFADQESLAKAYDALATALPENGYVCEQSAMTKPDAYEKAWCQALTDVTFEGETFKAPAEYDKFLTTLYGDLSLIHI